jgi:hypothetical protein
MPVGNSEVDYGNINRSYQSESTIKKGRGATEVRNKLRMTYRKGNMFSKKDNK